MNNVLNNIPTIYSIISFRKYLWSTYDSGTVFTTGDKTVNVVVSYLIIQTEFWHNIKANPLRTIWWEEGLFPKPNLPDGKAKVTISVAQSPTAYYPQPLPLCSPRA